MRTQWGPLSERIPALPSSGVPHEELNQSVLGFDTESLAIVRDGEASRLLEEDLQEWQSRAS
jgi:hypothetical protein